MSSRLKRLLHHYQNHISVPWQTGLAGVQKVIFVVYDKTDELRFRTHLTEFEIATTNALHGWCEIDISNAFPEWMATLDYKEGYFESPEDIDTTLDDFMKSVEKARNITLMISCCFPAQQTVQNRGRVDIVRHRITAA